MGVCKAKSVVQLPKGYNDADVLKNALKTGPVAIGIDAYLANHNEGIIGKGLFTGCGSKDNDITPTWVLVVGWGTSEPFPGFATKYWIIKGHSGPNWGDHGFGKILMKDGKGKGACTMYSTGAYVTGVEVV